MIGYDPSSKAQPTKTQHAVAGAASGFFTRAFCQPLDVLKIRFQLQWEPLSRNAPTRGMYTGVSQATRRIFKEEGMQALWKGHVPAQFLSVVYGTVQFVSYQLLTHMWHDYIMPVIPGSLANERSPITHFTCGCMSGAIGTLFSFPFDVIRTRLVAQGEPKMTSNRKRTYQEEFVNIGFTEIEDKGMKKPQCVVCLKVLTAKSFKESQLKKHINNLHSHLSSKPREYFVNLEISVKRQRLDNNLKGSSETKENNIFSTVIGTLGSGALAGLASKTLVYPLDLVKKRLQIRGFEEARKSFGKVVMYKGLWECLTTTVQQEGFLGLFKGFTPSVLKASSVSALHFAFYELALYLQLTFNQ